MSDDGIPSAKIAELADEFPRESIHWRAQSVTKTGDKAMALAYIDARDVMDRLDLVCGPENWQDRYEETPKGRVICTISINVGGYWVNKSDGAGDTAVEGDKGGISDAFKRAAVKWGIGRYLYDMPTPWVPCESYKDSRDKFQWRSWKQSPWNSVPTTQPKADAANGDRELILTLAQTAGVNLATIYESYSAKSIAALTDEQAKAAVRRLQATIKDRQKENA